MQAREPRALIVPVRVLRRVVKRHRRLGGFGFRVPHQQCWVIDRSDLLTLVDAADLPAAETLPETIFLLPESNADSDAGALEAYWRSLFHARIDDQCRKQPFDLRAAPARFPELSRATLAEIELLLRQESRITSHAAPQEVANEFVALFAEVWQFSPEALGEYFPGIADLAGVATHLDSMYALAELREATQPEGAVLFRGTETPDGDLGTGLGLTSPPSDGRAAEAARAKGNTVRAMILARHAGESTAAELDQFLKRLQSALEIPDDRLSHWREAITSLLPLASKGWWPVEARMLFDLQKAVVEFERTVEVVSLVDWAISWGRNPVRRPLPLVRDALILKHLRAAHRVSRSRLPAEEREFWLDELHHAEARVEHRLRQKLQPMIQAALDEVGLVPVNFPERIARDKLVAEFLDRLAARGYLTLGDLRDGLARNQLKLADVAGPTEFLAGDKLLQLNRVLRDRLDGLYRGGEFYLRWLQSVSALFFGTRWGRFFTYYLALPFGGAFLILEFLQHLGHGVAERFDYELHLTSPFCIFALGYVFLGLFYLPSFRQDVLAGLRLLWRGIRGLAYDWPRWLATLPAVQWFFALPPVVWFRQHMFKPTVAGLLTAAVLWWFRVEPWLNAGLSVAMAAAVGAFLHTRWGRRFEEHTADLVIDTWHHLSVDLIPRLFHAIMYFFRQVIERLEQILYTIDEWLRFQRGESRLGLAAKVLLGVVWFFIAYVVRFCIILLIEPQINPIKHFPVVTVAHKVLLPMVHSFGVFLSKTLQMELVQAEATALLIISAIPGIFGFLVWELKENYRLYAANRPRNLTPIIVGSHGEWVINWLKPGFHSGTIPRLFAKLRGAERAAAGHRRWTRWDRVRADLHHVEAEVAHFVDRELLAVLSASRAWEGRLWELRSVHLTLKRIECKIAPAHQRNEPIKLTWEEQAGRLAFRVDLPHWLSDVSAAQQATLAVAVTGLAKWAGVQFADAQWSHVWSPPPAEVRATAAGLAAWPSGDAGEFIAYERLGEHDVYLRPSPAEMPGWPMSIPIWQIEFDRQPLAWSQWVDVWEREQQGQTPTPDRFSAYRIVPLPETARDMNLLNEPLTAKN